MATVGYHASHEQLPPSALLRCVRRAEEAGFQAAMCSDHFAPWSERQGHSGFAWSWLGAALQATSLRFGVVTAPGQRYHPAVLAQAMGTLAEMFPGRFWAALGSGEAVNEHVTGDRWPEKPVRDERWEECADVVRRLLRGEEVSVDGHVRVDRAVLWSRPAVPPPVIAAAVSEATARRAGAWADGLITLYQPGGGHARAVHAFREGGGAGKPVHVQIHLSWEEDDDKALAVAYDQWRSNVFPSELSWNLELPSQFDAAARFVQPEDVRQAVLVSADLGRHRAWIEEVAALGVDGIYLHHVGQEQDRFIDAFGEHVLPAVAGRP